MYTHDVVQIVDVYPRNLDGHKQTMKIDPDGEAQSLSMLIRPLGRDARKIAIVAKDDERRLLAYQRAGYETHPMNGNRPTELRQFIRHMTAQIKQAAPKHTVLVSDDPEFVHLCDAVATITDLSVWANSATVPGELMDPTYGFRPLEELLPNLKIPRIDVRLDLENIFIGLVQRGWRPNLREMIEAIRLVLEDLGEIITITGYADWGELNRHHGGPNANWQRELTLAGGESRYVVNQHGKNTADMKIADDIRTLVEHEHGANGAIDIIGLATMDRDFRHIVDTARGRGKKVVLLALKGGLSRELEGVANEVRYLDAFLKLPPLGSPDGENAKPPQHEDITLMMRIAAFMHRNHWRFVYKDRLEQEFGSSENLSRLITEGWLAPSPNSPVDAQDQARMLEANRNNTYARAAQHLAHWIPDRLDHCLRQRGMPHVDSNYLANGMTRDATLTQLGVGQTRRAAENWLHAAARAGLVVANEQPHPQAPSKLITTWTLPEQSSARATAAEETGSATGTAEVFPVTGAPEVASANGVAEVFVAITPSTSTRNSSHARQLLTHGLSDAELTQVIFDHFRDVHHEVDGAPKVTRIQALLDFVERRGQHRELLAAIREVNPALVLEPPVEEPQGQLLAA